MDIIKRIPVPTGDILIVGGSRGKLEMLSIGDYGKDVNLKADFLGLKRRPDKVRHTKMLPLEEKWVITISTQYGCSIGCTFCDVPTVGPGRNASASDLIDQVLTGIELHPDVKTTKRLNIHFARMGEPTFNPAVLEASYWFKKHLDRAFRVHPVVSTMMPKDNPWLESFIHNWMRIKDKVYGGNAGLQLSINSTNKLERGEMFNGKACSFAEIKSIMRWVKVRGRRITLNFAVAGYEIDPHLLKRYFSPSRYVIKLTPMHKTTSCRESGVFTDGDYTTYEPYEEIEESLRKVGYNVLVFIASEEEDVSKITCGNAVLADPYNWRKVHA